MKNEIYLRFCIWEFEDITHEEISKMLQITPTIVHVIGEKFNPNYESVAKKNGWILCSSLEKVGSFEDQMNDLYDRLIPRIEILNSLSKKYYCELSCAVYIYYGNEESTPWVHLDSKYSELAKKMDIEFDLDLYCLSNE